MPRPPFSEMLFARRQELGLTITQAAKVLKIKEQVLVAFENGDFQNLPKSGYAQGMLSSYARYLGLNPRTVVDQFTEDLYQNTLPRNTDQGYGRRKGIRSRSERKAQANSLSSAVQDSQTNTFDSTSSVRLRSDSWYADRSSPLVNTRSIEDSRSSYQGGIYRGTSSYSSSYTSASQASDATTRMTGVGQPRRYTTRLPRDAQDSRSGYAHQSQRRQQTGPYAPRISGGASVDRYRDEDIYTRDVPSYYRDDLVLENQPTAYEAASTRMGRRSSRNISSTERPNNLQRGNRDSERRDLKRRASSQRTSNAGVLGFIQDFFSDSRRVIFVVLLALVVLLTVVIILSVRSCASSYANPSTVAVTEVTSSDSTSSDADEDEEDATDADADTTTDTTDTSDTSTDTTETSTGTTTVVVSLADSQISWLEIYCDGEYIVAETLTGPWEQSFEVTESITIRANNTSQITVTQDGERVQFSTTSGTGTISIVPS